MQIRPYRQEDQLQVMRVLLKAFKRTDESKLVDILRKSDHQLVELVAIENDRPVGHILFSPVECEGKQKLAGLGPMAVAPEFQNKGIGTALVEEGVRECGKLGFEGIVVVGHPEYYSRFGFQSAVSLGIWSDFDVSEELFMGKELRPNAFQATPGHVQYHEAFYQLESPEEF